ncbi:unnamed protein product [Lupinus luteus]|uniref:Uncharacterized protein n=1 Tax=Lupinus luteus TaxID=3873 RepID=A0AAV1WKL5_LUPLU
MAAIPNPIVGSHIWVEDPDVAWIDGKVLEVNKEEIKVLCTSGKTVVSKASNVYHKDTELPPSGVDDMTRLAYLHEPGVLDNLRSRYDINEIYTYTGNILIAVNPFRNLPHLYDSHMMAQYKGSVFGELSPHPFAVADAAYSQSILVSGESGAGKTECTKLLMRYLAYMGGRAAPVAEGRTVEQKVLESNPVLEAFGNAKTLRNNNSRSQNASIQEVKKYKLGNPRTFHYLNQSSCYELQGVDESKEYRATRSAMDVVGISSEEQDAIFRVVAAILHLGNVEFSKGKESDSSMPKDEKSRFHLETAAELFMCDAKALEDSLCKRVIVTRDEKITKWLDPESAALSRDALAKIVYTRLFDWLVDNINNSIGQDPESKSLIGVLDIYGFESFKTNSMLPRSTPETFAQNLYQTFKNHKRFSKPKFSRSGFTIDHYAGDQQLQALIETLNATEPHYIRCVKPNNLLKPAIFENKNVLLQLRCGGVMEAIRISCAGYPTRKTFHEFRDRFGLFSPKVLNGSIDAAAACKRIIENVGLEGYQIGKTKVFLRAGQMAELDTHRSEILGKSASIIQRKVRSNLAQRSFISVRLSAIQIQAACRGQLARKVYEVMRKEASSLMIQAYVRMHIVRKAYKELYTSASSIQTSMRGMAARCELRFRRQTRAAIVIQSHWRKYLAHIPFIRLRKAAITTQCAWRGKLARHELRKLKMAARETGALQAAKTKLEQQVEDLTLRLQLEKRLRVDMEEARTLENKRLQSALQETKILLEKEREATKKSEERVNVIQEIPVVDNALLEKLSSENEKLKNMLSSMEKKINETEKKYEEANRIGEERLKQALEAESKVIQLKNAMQRLEEKFSDTESAYHILQKQSQLNLSAKKIAEPLPTPVAEETRVAPVEQFDTESDTKSRRSFIERQHDQDGNDVMAYWLSNTSALLFLLEQSLISGGATAATSARKPPTPSHTSLFGRMAGFLSSPSANIAAHALEVVQKVDAKYPAMLFKQQLTAYLEKMYGIIRDNLKKELTSVLASCIQAPRASKGVSGSVRSLGKDSAIVLWQSIIESFNTLLCTLKANFVPPVLIQKIFSQTFSYINLQLFNSNGEYVKAGLAELEMWCSQAKKEYAGSSWDELKHIRQAVGFLVLLRMKMLMAVDSNSAQSDSFLIDDSTSIIPFSVGDLCKSLQLEDFSDLEPADELLENPAFQFLNE